MRRWVRYDSAVTPPSEAFSRATCRVAGRRFRFKIASVAAVFMSRVCSALDFASTRFQPPMREKIADRFVRSAGSDASVVHGPSESMRKLWTKTPVQRVCNLGYWCDGRSFVERTGTGKNHAARVVRLRGAGASSEQALVGMAVRAGYRLAGRGGRSDWCKWRCLKPAPGSCLLALRGGWLHHRWMYDNKHKYDMTKATKILQDCKARLDASDRAEFEAARLRIEGQQVSTAKTADA